MKTQRDIGSVPTLKSIFLAVRQIRLFASFTQPSVDKNSTGPLFAAAAILSIFVAVYLFTGTPLVNAQSQETTLNFWENPSILIFFCGLIGAIAPEIVRLYQLTQKGNEIIVPNRYFWISVAFAFLGGVVALVMEAKTFYAAFYNGLSIPSLVNTYVGEIIPSPVGNPKKRKITVRQYLGALSLRRSKNTRHIEESKKR